MKRGPVRGPEGQRGRGAVTALTFTILLAAGACKGKAADAATKSEKPDSSAAAASTTVTLPVVGQEVRKGDLILSVITTGQIRSESMAMLKSETSGTIMEVPVKPGDHVKKGQVLLRVDPRPLDLAVRDAEASLEQARLRLLDNTVPDSIVTGKAPPASGSRTPRSAPACRRRRCSSRKPNWSARRRR